MNATENPPPSEPPRYRSPYWRVFGPIGVLVAITLCLAVPGAEQLLLGWLYFPLRVFPRITVDWASVAVGALGALAFVGGLHFMLRWLTREMATGKSEPPPQVHFRTTLALAALVLVAFAAGTAMVGATHQIVWLLTGRPVRAGEPKRVEPEIWGFLSGARDSARHSLFRQRMKEFGHGAHMSVDIYKYLPPGTVVDTRGRLLHGWGTRILSGIGYAPGGIDFNVPWNEPPNDHIARCAVPEFLNPAIPEVFDRDGFGLSHVAGNIHVLPVMVAPRAAPTERTIELFSEWTDPSLPAGKRLFKWSDISDGQSQTLLIGQVPGRYKPWAHPANVREPRLGLAKSLDGFGGPAGSSSTLCLMCDGSVREIINAIDPAVFQALGTPSGMDVVPEDFTRP